MSFVPVTGRAVFRPAQSPRDSARGEGQGVAATMLQGRSWAPTPSNGSTVNVGTTAMVFGRPLAG